MEIGLSVSSLLIIDAVFLAISIALLLFFASKRRASFAVFKRNMLGYFNNPAGYVFLCVFVLLGSFAAFWPYEFFNSNLANLDQLNIWIPRILLVFIPTITMSIWAEERRQGTDELLLTIPAGDWDIVIGKYLAAVGIFTVSLMFSQISNFLVLTSLALGDVDVGLFVSTYFGYWMMGLAMVALGMVASFLTSNLTVGFIVGVIINAPFVFLDYLGRPASTFSFRDQMFDFSRGVVSLRSLAFFSLLIAIGLYLSVVLIGRRHWYGGKDGDSMFGHYAVRSFALLVTLGCLTLFFGKNIPIRLDATSQQISTLSSDTIKLIKEMDDKKTILIEAFISADVPDEYAQVRSDLVTKLNEISAKGGKKLQVHIHDNLEPFSDEAAQAEEQYGITPVTVQVTENGAFREDPMFLGAAFTSGLEKVVVPFFDRGIPVEYELVRSIITVARSERPRLGIVNTDARIFGGFDMSGGMPRQLQRQQIVTELEKQYEVVQIDPSSKIEEDVDVLLAVQPSSLNQQQLDNFTQAVRSGVPTAIFEDPFPILIPAPGTSAPKPPRGGMGGGMFGGGQPPEPKGNYQALWAMLGIELYGADQFGQFNADVIWHDYNPYEKVRQLGFLTKEWVFLSPEMPDSENPFPDDNVVSSNLNQLLFPCPGGIRNKGTKGLSFIPIASTSDNVGTIDWSTAQSLAQRQNPMADRFARKSLSEPAIIAAGIFSDPAYIRPGETAKSGSKKGSDSEDEKKEDSGDPPSGDSDRGINVVFVADIDFLSSIFFGIRAQRMASPEVDWNFDNVAFVLNIIDVLANDKSFVEIRKRKTRHSTLKLVEKETADASKEAEKEMAKFNQDFEDQKLAREQQQKEAVAAEQKKIDEIVKQQTDSGQELDERGQREIMKQLKSAQERLNIKQDVEQRRAQIEIERITRERDRNLKSIQRDLNKKVKSVQNFYKLLAVAIPPIPPLVLGMTVFMRRRMRERESITDARRR